MADAFMVKHFDRPNGRGYTVNYKYLAIAYFIEIVVVAASLLGGWLFAQQYGGGNSNFIWMMMLAPVAYACVELARVPLAFAVRVQTSWVWKVFFAVMVVAAAGVTVKSLSQLGEVMFRPRLHEVVTKASDLKVALNEQASIQSKIKAADDTVNLRMKELLAAEDRLKAVNTELASLPKQQCGVVRGVNSKGQPYQTTRCTTDPRVAAMNINLTGAQENVSLARVSLDGAQTARSNLDPGEIERNVSSAEQAHRHAVMDSQLHSFTGMFFGMSPERVTDGEIHFFLRWFVFFPAIFASLTATALALASVTIDLKPKREEVSVIDERATQYILDPLAEAVTQRAVQAALAAVQEATKSAYQPERDVPAFSPAGKTAGQEKQEAEKIIPLKGAANA